MTTINGDPNGEQSPLPAPSAAEVEAIGGIKVFVDRPEVIWEVVSDQLTADLGVNLLPEPLKKVQVKFSRSDADSFDLLGTLGYEYDFSPKTYSKPAGEEPELTKVEKVIRQFLAIYEPFGDVTAKRKNTFTFFTPSGQQLLLVNGDGSDIILSTGVTNEHPSPHVIPSPENQHFPVVINEFAQGLANLANCLYEVGEVQAPDEEIVISAPRIVQRSSAVLRDSEVNPEALLEKIEIVRPNISFSEIGGQAVAKDELEGLVEALVDPDSYKYWGTKPPKGILLWGPPGTGKTLLAKAVASQAEARFFMVNAADIGSMMYGQSEKLIQKVFELASESGGKTIIYFDELDGIARHRKDAHEATQRTITTLLQNIDGIGSNPDIMIMASTNRFEAIDPALLRPGRLNRWVEVGLPEDNGRAEILMIHMQQALDLAQRELFDNANLKTIVEHTKQFSGADLEEIVRRTLEKKVRQQKAGQEPTLATTDDFLEEIKSYERTRQLKNESYKSGNYL